MKTASPSMTAAVGGLVLLLIALAGHADESDGQQAPSPIEQRRILVLPTRDYAIDVDSLFWEGKGPGTEKPRDIALTESLVDVLVAEPELAPVLMDDVFEKADEQARDLVVRGMLHLGIERYRDLRTSAAAEVLDQGVAAARAEFLDVRSPVLAGDLFLYLGLSLLEQGDGAHAHVAFKNMFFVTPDRRFRKGYFPAETERAIMAAAVDFVQTYPKEIPLGSPRRISELMTTFGVTAMVYSFLDKSQGSLRWVQRFFETSTTSPDGVIAASSAVADLGKGDDSDQAAERAVSAWLACTDLPSKKPLGKRQARFFMSTLASYSIFALNTTTREPFHNAGFDVGLSYQAMEGLDVFGQVGLSRAFPDRYGDLVQGFWSVRGVAGVGYTYRAGWGRVFFHTGLEANYLSGFLATKDVDCKFWSASEGRCEATEFARPQYLIGIYTALGVDVRLFGPVYLSFLISSTVYAIANDYSLNFPVMLEMGLGYAFF